MVTDYLKYLGFNEQTIQTLPEDIMNAAIIYDGLQKIYMDIPATDVWKKESFAKAIALGTRNLLIRINYLVNNPQGVTQNVQQQITQLPPEVLPTIPKEEPPKKQAKPAIPNPPAPKPDKPSKPSKPTKPSNDKQNELSNKLKNLEF